MQFLTETQVDAEVGHKSASQRNRDRRSGLFPPAVRIGNRNHTVADELEIYKQAMKARRDYPEIANKLTAWLKNERKAGRNPWTQEKLDAFVQSNRKGR